MMVDAFIIGEGTATDTEFLIHRDHPRFIAKLWCVSLGNDVPLSPLSVELSNGDTLYDFDWIDPAPTTREEFDSLMQRASEAIYADSLKTAIIDDDEDD